jgi:DNA-directed RNA polymerase specialized sigma24 family protein
MDLFEQMNDEELLAATPSQPEAFGTFYRRHERAMLVFFLRRVSTPEVAADLTAEVFVAALPHCDGSSPGKHRRSRGSMPLPTTSSPLAAGAAG